MFDWTNSTVFRVEGFSVVLCFRRGVAFIFWLFGSVLYSRGRKKRVSVDRLPRKRRQWLREKHFFFSFSHVGLGCWRKSRPLFATAVVVFKVSLGIVWHWNNCADSLLNDFVCLLVVSSIGQVLEMFLGSREHSNRESREGSMGPPSRQSSNASACSINSLHDSAAGSQFFEVWCALVLLKRVTHNFCLLFRSCIWAR